MSRRTALWLLALIILCGTALRAYELTARSIWFDEAFSWRMIQFPFTEMLTRIKADVHPPLYYIVLRGWAYGFGSILASLRWFSIVLSALTVAASYLYTAYAWNSRKMGLLSASLIAFSGWQISLASEARMYTLGTFIMLVSSWLILRAARSTYSSTPHWQLRALWGGYAVTAAALIYVHYYALFIIAAQALWLIGAIIATTRGRIIEILQLPLTKYAAVSIGIIMIAVAPWIPVFLSQRAQVETAYWIPPISRWSIPDTIYRMFLPTAEAVSHTGVGVIGTVLPFVIVILIGAWLTVVALPKDAAWLTLLSGVLPFLMSTVLSLLQQSIFQDRFFIFAHVFILIGGAGVMLQIRWLWLRRIGIAAVLGGFLIIHMRFWQELDIAQKPGTHAAAKAVLAKRQPAEPILVSSPFIFFAVDHYLQEEFKGVAKPYLFSESGDPAHFAGGPILKNDDVVDAEFFKNIQNSAVWMIDTSGFGASPPNIPAQWQRTEKFVFPEVYPHQGEVVVSKFVRVAL